MRGCVLTMNTFAAVKDNRGDLNGQDASHFYSSALLLGCNPSRRSANGVTLS